MEISVVNGTFGAYRYEDIWWRDDHELHWRAHVFRDSEIAAFPTGTVLPLEPGDEDDSVRQSIEAFIETSEDSTAPPHYPD